MSVVGNYVNYCFTRYQKGYSNDAQVVSRLLNTKEPEKALKLLLERIKGIPHWQEVPKLKNLLKEAKISLKNNFSVEKKETAQNVAINAWPFIAQHLTEVKPLFQFARTCKEIYAVRHELMAQSPKQLSLYLSDLLAKRDEKRIFAFLQSCKESSYVDTPVELRIRTTWPRQAIVLHEIQKKFSTIQRLTIEKLDITDKEFETLLSACPRALELSISGCTALTAPYLANASYPTTLEGLQLSGTSLTDPGLQSLLGRLPNLKRLDITNCPAISVMARYAATLPSCIELYSFTEARYEDIKEELKRCLEAAPDNLVLLVTGIHLTGTREYQKKLEALLKSHPNYYHLHFTLCMNLLHLAMENHLSNHELFEKYTKQADVHLQLCLQLKKDDPDLALLFAITYAMRQKYAEARLYACKYLAFAKGKDDVFCAHALLGNIYLNLGQFKEAKEHLALAETRETQFSLALLQVDAGDVKEAKRLALLAFENGLKTKEQFIGPRLSMTCAKLCKLLLDDPAAKEKYGSTIKEFFRICLQVDPLNSELQTFILSCTL